MTEQTQQKIVDAAIEVFNDDLSAPLEKVAERAEVTRRTLHRYFNDRADLMAGCEQVMQLNCRKAMQSALDSSTDSLVQLERMLYAGIDCGAKYSFFYKLHMRNGHQHKNDNEDCAEFDSIAQQFNKVVMALRDDGIISTHLTPEWVHMLFSSVIIATVNGLDNGIVAKKSVKDFAWFSFSKGIGINAG
jgi:AcrR family transcriptional regulator